MACYGELLSVIMLGLVLSARPIVSDYVSLSEIFGAEAVLRCRERCPFQNRTGEGHFDLNCGPECSMQQCVLGCSLWKQALESSCQKSCNVASDTVFSRELYCVIGCNEALNSYFQKLRELIGTPPAPALVADSLTNTSLSLVWEALSFGNLSYLLQWRYEELPGSWQYYNGSYTERSVIHVWNLQPYTKYRFRVSIFISGRSGTSEPIYSAPSVVISTLEDGKPSSPPSALRAAAPDPSRVAISWQPGQFANGPLIGYVLRLTDTKPNGYSVLKEMPASNNTLFYMFQNLKPAREYEVSVAMRNAEGEGPRAIVKISTPPLPTSTPQQPILILGGEHNILAAPANDMFSDPLELYYTSFNITGFALDISNDYLFVSETDGFIYRSSLSNKSNKTAIVHPDNISYNPLDLSVDWLNGYLYILGEVYYNKGDSNTTDTMSYPSWEILRCDFNGGNHIVAISGFNSRPIHFEVDPYNGYLFYALRGGDRGGLYRLDLANISNGVRHDTPPELIVKDPHLGPFTVDYTDFRLLVAHLRKNNILAVSLDGYELTDFRSNTQASMFIATRSIAYANGLFYWTNGKEMLTEEYHDQSDSYFHNEYPVMFNMTKINTRQVLVNLRSCQPIPVPVNPPITVQSVMGIDRAKVSWSAPHLLGHQGNGAWQQWEYVLQLHNTGTGEVIERTGINSTNCEVYHLREDSEYILKVAAVTRSGSGPWSSYFISRTLASTLSTNLSSLIWSGPEGLFQTDITGDNMMTLIHRENLKNLHITDISWHGDILYLVTNISTVMWFNNTTHEWGFMNNMENVGSIAVDWVGKRLYWSNPKQQLITRGGLDGSNREPVPIVTVAKELTIDSLEAFIYWNTGHAVEAARLNGENKMVYYPAQLFSGRQVMGLASDLKNRHLYWLVRSYDGSELHRAPTAEIFQHSHEASETLVSRLDDALTLGPLCEWNSRLLWVQETSAVLSDLHGRYIAQLRRQVYAVAIRDPTSRNSDSDSIIAIPEPIDPNSIKIEGTSSDFDISWKPSSNVNVNKSRVVYDVIVHSPHYHSEVSVDVPLLRIVNASIAPYSPLRVAVRATTLWGGGGAVGGERRTPQHTPTAPTRPRVYLHNYYGGDYISVIFRWEMPEHANGIIRGFDIQCWAKPDTNISTSSTPCADTRVPANTRQLVLRDDRKSNLYSFQVRAYTDAGPSPFTEVISASSNDINPVPKVIISSQESIKILDLDVGDTEIIPKSTGLPVDFGLSISENIVYWINNLEEIFYSRFNGSGHSKLTSINGSASTLCVDWVSRSVYWTQHEMSLNDSYVTYRLDIGLPNTRSHVTRLFARKYAMHNLKIVPLKRSLYWYEETENENHGKLMHSKVNGNDMQEVFTEVNKSNCNCTENPNIAKSFTIDMTRTQYEIYWVDLRTKQIMASDIQGCYCRIVVTTKQLIETPTSLTVDSKYVYWYSSSNKIFYADKMKESATKHYKANGYDIVALDPSTQPYPPKHCMYPGSVELVPSVVNKTPNSLTIELPKVLKVDRCSKYDYETTLTEYTVFYKLEGNNTICDKDSCEYTVTTEREITLNELKPYTIYTIVLEVTNYYAKIDKVKPITWKPVVMQTAAEAPKPPKSLKVTVLSPVLARVEWTPEPEVLYELHWRTDESTSLPYKFKEHNTWEVCGQGLGELSRLSANTRYSVWVVATKGGAKAKSALVELKTYALPTEPKLIKALITELVVSWKKPAHAVRYHVEYKEVRNFNAWKPCNKSGHDQWTAMNLNPGTKYKFRVQVQYVAHGNSTPFHWPDDDRFTHETPGDVPSPPTEIRAEAVGSGVVRAVWSEPDSRGSAIIEYRVWGRLQGSENEEVPANSSDLSAYPSDMSEDDRKLLQREGLSELQRGPVRHWTMPSTDSGMVWRVRVQSCNALGWGTVSSPQLLFVPSTSPLRPPLAALAAILVLAVAVVAGILYMYNNRNKKQAALENQVIIRRGPDVELATLRQLPIRHSNNIIYNQGLHPPTDSELASLPHIRREQITLTKFLGSGAFGEVFEGIARGLDDAASNAKVAVKTLRKGATDQEKTEFLQEAALMSNFKHDHILRLLGVCLDNDPNYIIMELMEGGDLLSYLRAKRVTLYTSESLTLLDLLNMCVDVTKGCRYLEEMHFVHRDLACRNCLVAHRANGRVVKIGDFGLARDIYKNDYYRKEGEGLLPVRWMAVESLVDGVFSCQSDVWSWAVLCWEILSLGHQPYPGRTNRQVLAYVRAGGVPDRPPNCPALFYDLLQKCWSFSPDSRPTFKQCLDVVTTLRDKTSSNIRLTATVGAVPQYLTLIGEDGAVENRTYLLDENDNAFIDAQEPPAPHVQSEQNPKYLEILSDAESSEPIICDGYEIPISLGGHSRALMPSSRHSIVGATPNKINRQIYRTHSLRANMRPPNATIVPLRNGTKRTSLCEGNDSFILDSSAMCNVQSAVPISKHDVTTLF